MRVLARALLIAGVTVGVLCLAVSVGPSSIGGADVLASVISHVTGGQLGQELSASAEAIVWDLRAPRVLLGAVVGAALASAGAGYQGAFLNPLADPYLLGAAAGAGVGVTGVVVLAATFPLAAQTGAFLGALCAVAAALLVSWLARGGQAVLILSGVAMASFLTAIQTILQQANLETERALYAWLLGRLSTATWTDVYLSGPIMLVAVFLMMGVSRRLDVLGFGDDEATSLGMRPTLTRSVVVVLASLATAAAVAVSGLIAFVGLLVPHAARHIVGTKHLGLIPASALLGALFLVTVDTFARTALAPAEIPVGVVTAAIGAPGFVLLLVLRRTGATT